MQTDIHRICLLAEKFDFDPERGKIIENNFLVPIPSKLFHFCGQPKQVKCWSMAY